MHTEAEATGGFDHWLTSMSKIFAPFAARRICRPCEFRGAVSSVDLGSVVLADVTALDTVIDRTHRLIRRDDRGHYQLGLQVSGESMIEQDGRQAHLQPGDLAIFDTSRPYRISFGQDFDVTAALIPRSLMSLSEQQMSGLTSVRLAGDAGPASLIASLLRGLSADLGADRPAIGSHLGDAVVDLVNATFAQQVEMTLDPTSRIAHRQLIAQVKVFIDGHLQDPGLSTKIIAEAHFVSVRLLQKAFEADCTSVSALIRSRRLDRCRRDLANPRLVYLSIAEVGYRWGFPEPAHFSRVFRSAYGVSPREFRKQLVAQEP